MPVNHNELTKEMIMQALKCKNADELIADAASGRRRQDLLHG